MKKIKVAIYSRKSIFTGKGESIENQVQMCKNYYSKISLNPDIQFEVYEDEGYTGANIKRPEFQRLLNHIKRNKISVLICYRLDRISRNVADFSSILELLQSHNVAFISIKEQFDTSTPIGKAMVYIASVFAQLERDTIAERIRDNMLELSKTGRWLGGQLPLGFKGEKITYIDYEFKERSMHKLSPISKEISIVKQIFNDYLTTNSIEYVLKKLSMNNLKGKNGGEFANASIKDILRNPVYVKSNENVKKYLENKNILFCGNPNECGIMLYNKRISGKKLNPTNKWIASVAMHEGIIDAKDWLKVQNTLDENESKRASTSIRLGTSKQALLSGILKCSKCGFPMRITYGRTRKDGTKTYYYTCTHKYINSKEKCTNPNCNGPLLEKEIIKFLFHYDSILLKKRLKLLLKRKFPKKVSTNTLDLEINSLTLEIDNLLNQMSKTNNETTQELILNKVNNISKELQKLKNIKNKKHEYKSLNNKSNYSEDILSNFPKLYSFIEENYNIDTELKDSLKRLLRKLIKEIIYDGESGDIIIYTIDSK